MPGLRRRVLRGLSAAVTAAAAAAAVSTPARAEYVPDPGTFAFSISGYSGPGDLTVHFLPTPAAQQAMADGVNVAWSWGDGTSCQANPPDPAYIADPDSHCIDPTDVSHTYPATPGQHYQAYWVFIGSSPSGLPLGKYSYAYGTGEVPGRPLLPDHDWANYTVYDDEPTPSLDLTEFVPRQDIDDLRLELDTTSNGPVYGTAAIDSTHHLVITPDGSGHGRGIVWVGFDSPGLDSSQLAVIVDIVAHTAPQISGSACSYTAHNGRYSCAVAVRNNDRAHTSTSYTASVVNSLGKKVLSTKVAVAGGRSVRLLAGLPRGTYRVMVTNTDHRSTTRSLTVGPRAAVATSGVRVSAIQFDPPGADTRSNASLNAEWVRLKNTTSTAKTITGWTLRDAQSHVYTFPATTLAAGSTLRVHTGSGANGKYDRYWRSTSYIWNNTADTATLRSARGTVVSRCGYSGGSSKTC